MKTITKYPIFSEGMKSTHTDTYLNVVNLSNLIQGRNWTYSTLEDVEYPQWGSVTVEQCTNFVDNKKSALKAKADGKQVLYQKLKESSSLYILQSKSFTRAKLDENVSAENLFYTPTPFIVIDIDNIDSQKRAKLIEFFKLKPYTLAINYSSSGKGLHVFLKIQWDKPDLNAEMFRRRYVSISLDLTNEFGDYFVDLALANIKQPIFITPHNIFYQNIKGAAYTFSKKVLDVINDYDEAAVSYFKFLSSQKGLGLNKSTDIGSKTELLPFADFKNNFNKEKLKLDRIKSVWIAKDRKGNSIDFSETVTDYPLTLNEQLRAIGTLTRKSFNPNDVKLALIDKPEKTFNTALNTVLMQTMTYSNIEHQTIFDYLSSFSQHPAFIRNLEHQFEWYKNIADRKEKVAYIERRGYELDTKLLNEKLAFEVTEEDIEGAIVIKSNEKLSNSSNYKPALFDYLIADTRSGKSWTMINWLKNEADKSKPRIIIVPTILLRTDLSKKELLKIMYAEGELNLDEVYVATYDAYVSRLINGKFDATVIVDEVHTIITETYRPKMAILYDAILAKSSDFILMTATKNAVYEGYHEVYVKFDKVETSELTFFSGNFVGYVVSNIDKDDKVLIYYNNVEKGLQSIYNDLKKRGIFANVFISENNETFLRNVAKDKLLPEYTESQIYLATKVIEVGIGLDVKLNKIFINPYSGDSVLSKQDITQLINRDNRGNDTSGSKVVSFYLKKDMYISNGESYVRSNMNTGTYSKSYKKAVKIYKDEVYKSINETVTGYPDYVASNKYFVKSKDSSESCEKLEIKDLLKLKQLDFEIHRSNINKMANLIDAAIIDGVERLTVMNFIQSCTYSEYMQAIRLNRIKALYGEHLKKFEDLTTSVSMTTSELHSFVKNIVIEKMNQGMSLIDIDTEYNIKSDILFALICRQQRNGASYVGYYIDGVKRHPLIPDEVFDWKTDKPYSKSDIKLVCKKHGFTYSVEILKFKERQVLINGKRVKCMYLNIN